MATNSGIITQGTTFGISVDGVSYTQLGCIQSFSVAGAARTEIDTTCMLDNKKSFKLGLKDNNTISVELLYDPANSGQALLEDSYESDDFYFFKIEYNDSLGTNGTTKEFNGYVTSISQDAQLDEVLRQSVEIKTIGNTTTTPAA